MKSIDDEVMAHVLAQVDLRTVEYGDCRIWQGAMGGRGPVLTFRGKQYAIRQVLWVHANGQDIPAGHVIVRSCEMEACVDHGSLLSRAALMGRSNRQHSATRGASVAEHHRQHSRYPQAVIERIRLDGRATRVIAAELGCSHSYVARVKRNQTRRDYTNPFAGMFTQLGARA